MLKFIKKQTLAQMFSCKFSEFFHNIIFIEPFGHLLHNHSFCLLSHPELSPFQKRCHKYFPDVYFLGLICRLGTSTVQKMKFSIKEFFSKCDELLRNLRIWPHLLKKSLMENFIFFCSEVWAQCFNSLHLITEIIKSEMNKSKYFHVR